MCTLPFIYGILELRHFHSSRVGAVIRWTKELVTARVANVTIGGCVRELYDHKLHGEREQCAYIDTEYVIHRKMQGDTLT